MSPRTLPASNNERISDSLKQRARRTFSSLNVRNYRLFFFGQTISQCGTWMQSMAQGLLVLQLTHSGTVLGLVLALQFLPVLVLAPFGGVLADRLSKRKLLYVTQTAAGLLALALGVLVATGEIRIWMVFVLATALGFVNAFDNPARQTFVHEMVGPTKLNNAITLNSIIANLSRVIGPAIGAVLVAAFGYAPCFIINAASFIAVLACLAMMDANALHRAAPVERAKGQLRAGFAYARKNTLVRDVLLMMAVVGTLTYEFAVSLPLLAHVTYHGSPAQTALAAGWLMSVMGVGAVIGGLVTAGRRRATIGALTVACIGFGLATALAAVSPTITWAIGAMVIVGFFSVPFTALTNTILQTATEARMRGRVMALWAMAFMGSTVIGAPIIGWVGQVTNPHWSLGVGAIAALAAGGFGLHAMRRSPRGTVTELPGAGERSSVSTSSEQDGLVVRSSAAGDVAEAGETA